LILLKKPSSHNGRGRCQALKLVLSYATMDWAAWAQRTAPTAESSAAPGAKPAQSTDEPPSPTPETSIRCLNRDQMVTLTQTAKTILRDSLQRRAVLRAEAAVAGGGVGGRDEDDAADEMMFMQDSMEVGLRHAVFLAGNRPIICVVVSPLSGPLPLFSCTTTWRNSSGPSCARTARRTCPCTKSTGTRRSAR
jgi:hypothetical protein